MKGDRKFRETSKSFVMCRNEVLVYEQVIPYLRAFLRERSIEMSDWIPRMYKVYYGEIPGNYLLVT